MLTKTRLLVALLTLFTVSLLVETPTRAATYDCSLQTDIPQIECEALVALYNSTNGVNWDTNTNWLTSTPCNWVGISCNNNRVVQIYLSNNFLVGPLPPQLGNLTALTILNLSSNRISGFLPSEIGNLTQLTQLDLYDNRMTGTLPETIGGLTSLAYAHLSNNSFEGPIPTTIGNLINLESLYLSSNQLSGSLPTTIGGLSKLLLLSLDGNKLSGTIPDEIGNLSLLQNLGLAWNDLSGTLPPNFGNLTRLKTLSLYMNLLSGEIPSSFVNLQRIVTLDITGNMLTASDPAVNAFIEGILPNWQTSQLIIPTDLSASPIAWYPGVDVTWEAPGLYSKIELGYATVSGGQYTVVPALYSPFKLSYLAYDTTYYIVIRAVLDRQGYSTVVTPWSAEVQVTTASELQASQEATATTDVNYTPAPYETSTPQPTPIPFYAIAPFGTISDPMPVFEWTAYPSASVYGLRIRDSFDTTLVNASLNPAVVCNETVCSVDLSFFNEQLENNEAYTWQVQVNNGQLVSYGNFTTNFSLPTKATLISPENNAVVNSTAPVFRWTVSQNSTQYRLRVLDSFDARIINITFTVTSSPSINDICADGVCTFDSSTLGIALEHNEDYEWRVRAKNEVGKANSLTSEFSVQLPLPGSFNLASPANGSTVDTFTPILQWQESSGATDYQIKIRDSEEGALMLKVKGLIPALCVQSMCSFDTVTAAFIAPLKSGDTYEWRVQARNQFGKAKSVNKWTFDVSGSDGQILKLPEQP
jgi:hypothetical protein